MSPLSSVLSVFVKQCFKLLGFYIYIYIYIEPGGTCIPDLMCVPALSSTTRFRGDDPDPPGWRWD